MKLLTEIRAQEPDGVVYACGHCVTTEYLEPKAFEAVAHDDAAAHALMQALHEHAAKFGTFSVSAESSVDAITNRADELMRQWGFEK